MANGYEGLSTLKRSGLRENTTERFVVDAGAVYVFEDLEEITGDLSKEIPMDPDDWDDNRLGATSGGNTFEVETEWRTIDIDGIKGEVKGARRKIAVMPQLTANVIEFSEEALKYAFPGADIEDWPLEEDLETEEEASHKLFTRECNIDIADYVDLVALVGTLSLGDDCNGEHAGEPVIFLLENGLNDQTITMTTNDEDEIVFELTFSGHYDYDNLNAEPWKILLPKEEE